MPGFRRFAQDAARLGFSAQDALRTAVALDTFARDDDTNKSDLISSSGRQPGENATGWNGQDAFNEGDHPREGGKFAAKAASEAAHAATQSARSPKDHSTAYKAHMNAMRAHKSESSKTLGTESHSHAASNHRDAARYHQQASSSAPGGKYPDDELHSSNVTASRESSHSALQYALRAMKEK